MLRIGRFFKGEQGQAMVEYALILALVAAVCIAAMKPIAGALNSVFQAVASSF